MAAAKKIDTLAWTKELREAGVPNQQAEVQVGLFLRIAEGTMCTKQILLESETRTGLGLKALELKIAEVQKELSVKTTELKFEIAEVQKELSVKTTELKLEIAEVRAELKLEIAAVKKDLSIEIEKIRKEIIQVKADLSTQIARWVLGVSLFQTTVILTFIRFFSLS